MPKNKYILIFSGILLTLVTWQTHAGSNLRAYSYAYQTPSAIPGDTTKKDSLSTVPARRGPSFFSRDRYGDPFSNRTSSSPLNLNNPSSIKLQVRPDTNGNVTIYEKVGDLDYRPANSLTFKEFSQYQDRRLARDYWKSKAAAEDGKSEVTGRNLIPKIYISPVFDRIFGGNYIDFKTNGFVSLDFGGKIQRTANPTIPIRQQRVPLFDFDQQISMNVIGQVGEKMKMTANFDTKASFQFEQSLRLEYTGFEEDIIQKIEAGNVSLPLNSSLITGAQNLFGLKTQLRFGRLNVTAIAANQRASLDQISTQGGVQTRRFELKVSEYQDNQHFFLSQYFRNQYEAALRTIPIVSSGVNITRVEVYITNRANNTQTLRNIAALTDLAEAGPYLYKPGLPIMAPFSSNPKTPASNKSNALYANLAANPTLRQVDNASSVLEGIFGVGGEGGKGSDFELLRSARKLSEREFTFHPELGYISLVTPLRNDEVLAVAYQYTQNGRTYTVGELTEDYQNQDQDQVIILKLLRPSTVRIDLPTWNLMMKNIYSIGNNQINRQGFQLRVIYKDDLTGIDNPSLQEGRNTKDVPLVQILKLDQLNPQNDPQIDGNFDFIEGITVDTRYGRIIFPVLEPFGSHLEKSFTNDEQELKNKYVFNTLYRSTKQEAQQVASKNKFFIKGSYQSSASNELMLPGIGSDENSVVVTAGGVPLVLGQDYIIEGNYVKIINEGISSSGKQINIQFEKPDLFNNQQRFLLGARLDYLLSKDFTVGGTVMKLKERPIITRVGLGNEPTNNTILGLDANMRKESRFLTKMLDKLPLLATKEISTINLSGEYAKLLPGVAPLANNNSFIDDFEGAETPFRLSSFSPHQDWKLGSTPRATQGLPQMAYDPANPLSYSYRRAKLAWYSVDRIFYSNSGLGYPDNITDEDKKNHYIRAVQPQEIFRQRAAQQIPVNEAIFDLAYFPSERGMYNYNPDLNNEGGLKNPENSWASLSRAMTYDIDFDNANVQYIEFWLMDPFITGDRGRNTLLGISPAEAKTGGELYLNLGSVSEDVMKDGLHAFENGLPFTERDSNNIKLTPWGRVTTNQFLNDAFQNESGARERQDIGLDGFPSNEEAAYFQENFISKLGPISNEARERILNDPSADDFAHFLDPRYDAGDAKILERYKNFNGMENNSPEAGSSQIARSATNYPNNEDLNKDNTISDVEAYYQYKISIRPQDMQVGKNHIVDKVVNTIDGEEVAWYQFRIPIRENYEKVGNINGFKSIRFMRMFLTRFSQPIVLRFAQYQLVSNQWRAYTESLFDKRLQEPLEPYDAKFTLATVNIEENSQGSGSDKTPYVIPPGFQRDRDITTLNNRQLNEQSLQLCVENLSDRDSRAAFKNVNLDLINYKRLKMFLHADSDDQMNPGEVSAFIRLGTDFTENYYEIEVPLELSDRGETDPERVWPSANEIDVAFSELIDVKADRNRNNASLLVPYALPIQDGRYTVRVIGNPDLSAVQTVMIGIHNPFSPDQQPKSVCIWANELRASGFDQESGWAATGRLSAKLADFATITASIRHTTYGFGGIQQKISERARENTTQYDISSNINLDKLLPAQLGLKVPMFVSYERQRISPRFNPLDPDMPLKQSLNSLRNDKGDPNAYRKLVEDNTVRRSINFTNVQKIRLNPDAKVRFYDIENLSFSYAYSDILQTNITTDQYLQKNYRGGLAYTYNTTPKSIEPFKNIAFLSSPFLKWLQDFNFSLMPASVMVRGDLDRTFTKTQLRSSDLSTVGILPTYEKYFTFNRLYDVKWNLTKSLTLDYSATANALIDEPRGEINDDEVRPGFSKRDSVIANLKRLGRMKNFSQRVTATYRLPLDKFPLTDWLNADVRYSGGYNWTAASLAAVDTAGVFFGNTIQNSRDRQVNGRVDLTRLYNKVKFLKDINTPTPAQQRPAPKSPQAAKDTTDRPPELRALKSVLRALMSARSITFTYGLEENTILPGFLPSPKFFGVDSSFTAPGLPFVLGSQDPTVRFRMAENGLLSKSTSLNTQFSQTITENINVRTALEPFRDFKIQLDAKRLKATDYNEFFRLDSLGEQYVSQSPIRTGSYNISFITIATAFKKDDSDNESPVFQQFEKNLAIISARLEEQNEAEGKYGRKSQDVMIPSFIAAYTGKDANDTKLSAYPLIPLPNWRVDYAGLSRLEMFKNIFSSVNLTHSYASTYSVNNYTSSLEYGSDAISLNGGRTPDQMPSLKGDSLYIPVYVIDQVAITERFAPLIGINVRTINKITARVEYNQERNLLLSMSSVSQLTEIRNKDIVLGIGFTKANVKVPFKFQGKNIVLKNDLNFRCDFTLRDSKTITRAIGENSTVTAGNLGIQFKPAISYVMNQRLNLQVYFERNINDPRVSLSNKRTLTAFGVNLRYSLSQ